MVPRQHRLKKKSDIELVFAHGRFVPGDVVNLKLWRIDEKRFPRRGYERDDLKFAFVVGKKVEKSAVKRNRLKRRMREAVRLLLKEGCLQTGFLVVVIAKPEMVERGFSEIAESIKVVLRKAKVLM